MIVSHKHQFIYFAVPRTATHSVRAALAPHLGADDWQQEGLSEKHVLPVAQLARAGHGHIGVRALQPHLTKDQWNSYYKFGVVRHPYDRFISVCAFLNRNNEDFAISPVEWMLKALERERFVNRMLVRPQVEMLIDHNGELALDFIGRFEQLAESMKNVAIQTGIDDLVLRHENSSSRSTVSDYLTQPLAQALNDFYRRDFEMLNYETTEI